MKYRLAYPPTRGVGWPIPQMPPPQPAGDWVPTTIEPTVSEFAANQQSVAQVWEAVRRAGAAEIARRAGTAAAPRYDPCGSAAPGAKTSAAAECHLDGRASPETAKPRGNASP